MQEPLFLAFILIAVGLALLVLELFLYSAILFVLAVCGIVGGITMVFMHSSDPYLGWLTVIGIFVIVPALIRLAYVYGRQTSLGKRMLSGPAEDATIATMPVNVELEQLRGRLGRTLSALRPAGVVDFDGRRIDTITEGMMVEPGAWVRCIDVRAGRVVVRPVEKPELTDLENMDLHS